MNHFPIFLDTAPRTIVLAGGGEAAVAKLRLLLKTRARLTVAAPDPSPEIAAWAAEGRVELVRRAFAAGDAAGTTLVYAATEDEAEDARVARLARAEGALVNIVDNLEGSDFITPAIVDRDPVTVAIGTEGAAPVLARSIKAGLEARLPAALGRLARVGKAFRKAAETLPMGRRRRDFWAEYYDTAGPQAYDAGGDAALRPALEALLDRHLLRADRSGHVALVGAGPGDPELLTLKARRALDEADVVIHDRLIAPEILELARREARVISAGKQGFGPSTPQDEINRLMIAHAHEGAQVVRLKSGDPGVYGRLDDEADALDAAGVAWSIVPGITAASAAAAGIGQSLTRRGRNGALRLVTGHDMTGFAEQDWRALAAPGAVTAIYMGKRAARFLQGRLLMHGAAPDTPVTVVENATHPDERRIPATLRSLPAAVAELAGPAVLLLGLAPRAAATHQPLELEAAQ
ncbi:uroporphyrinogen-III C-methyltransferase [Rhodobacteraceae bacterium WD3A24]|nr:uroporphyrinogen-III C-methyltransferase [Rhodobacteraceae bacterium WD3A24]